MHTEEQAREKFCPISRSSVYPRCVASKCMMWRWAQWPKDAIVEGNSDGSVTAVPYGGTGYCGMAGKLY